MAQDNGKEEAFRFLKLPLTAQMAALGEYNVSSLRSDPGLSYFNPALLRKEMNGKTELTFRSGVAGLKNANALYAGYSEKWQSAFHIAVLYFNYGKTEETDFAGNILGYFQPADYAVQAGISRRYEEHWYYGASVKYMNSHYAQYISSGIGLDVGVNYMDTSNGIQVGLVLRNMGSQLKSYAGSDKYSLPFDLILGLSKKIQNAPIQLSLTAHSLHDFNLLEEYTSVTGESAAWEEIFSHLVWGVQIYAGQYVELSAGYNYLGRVEQSIMPYAKGFTGLSFGMAVLFKRLNLRYSTGVYQPGSSRHYFGVGMNLKEL